MGSNQLLYLLDAENFKFWTIYIIICFYVFLSFNVIEYYIHRIFTGNTYRPFINIFNNWYRLPININKRYKTTNYLFTYEISHISVIDIDSKYATNIPHVGIFADDVIRSRKRLCNYYRLSKYESIIYVKTIYPDIFNIGCYPCIMHLYKVHPGYKSPKLPNVKWYLRSELLSRALIINGLEKKLLENYHI